MNAPAVRERVDRAFWLEGFRDFLALADHLQCGGADRTEIRVRAGQRRNQGRLQELQEPGPPYPGVAEDPLEVGVERPEIQQRLVDVEDANPRHAPYLSLLLADQRRVVDHYDPCADPSTQQ